MIYDVRCTVSVCEAGENSVRCRMGVCHRYTETLLISGTCPYGVYYGSTTLGFEVVCDQQELFNVTSNALFCIFQVWQDFILNVVLRLLSRSTNFHSSKHIRDYTQDGLVNLRST